MLLWQQADHILRSDRRNRSSHSPTIGTARTETSMHTESTTVRALAGIAANSRAASAAHPFFTPPPLHAFAAVHRVARHSGSPPTAVELCEVDSGTGRLNWWRLWPPVTSIGGGGGGGGAGGVGTGRGPHPTVRDGPHSHPPSHPPSTAHPRATSAAGPHRKDGTGHPPDSGIPHSRPASWGATSHEQCFRSYLGEVVELAVHPAPGVPLMALRLAAGDVLLWGVRSSLPWFSLHTEAPQAASQQWELIGRLVLPGGHPGGDPTEGADSAERRRSSECGPQWAHGAVHSAQQSLSARLSELTVSGERGLHQSSRGATAQSAGSAESAGQGERGGGASPSLSWAPVLAHHCTAVLAVAQGPSVHLFAVPWDALTHPSAAEENTFLPVGSLQATDDALPGAPTITRLSHLHCYPSSDGRGASAPGSMSRTFNVAALPDGGRGVILWEVAVHLKPARGGEAAAGSSTAISGSLEGLPNAQNEGVSSQWLLAPLLHATLPPSLILVAPLTRSLMQHTPQRGKGRITPTYCLPQWWVSSGWDARIIPVALQHRACRH